MPSKARLLHLIDPGYLPAPLMVYPIQAGPLQDRVLVQVVGGHPQPEAGPKRPLSHPASPARILWQGRSTSLPRAPIARALQPILWTRLHILSGPSRSANGRRFPSMSSFRLRSRNGNRPDTPLRADPLWSRHSWNPCYHCGPRGPACRVDGGYQHPLPPPHVRVGARARCVPGGGGGEGGVTGRWAAPDR